MSESLSYLTPFRQSIRNVLGYDPFTLRSTTAPQNTSVVEQLLAAERARSLAAPGAPDAPEAPRAYGDMEGDSASNPSPSTPSPDQSLQGIANSIGTGLAVGTGPMGIATAIGSLTLSDLAGRSPSFNIGNRGALSALSDIFGFTTPQQTALNAADLADLDSYAADLAALTTDPNAINEFYAEDAAAAAANAVSAEEAAEANAMAQGLQSPGFGFGSYGYGTPSTGGSGNFGAAAEAGRGGTVGPPGQYNDQSTYGQGGGAPGPGPGPGASVGSPGDYGTDQSDSFKSGGLVPLAGGGKIAIGPGGGLDDLIPTSINGRRAAALSDGEFVMPADVVSMMGDGSSNAGARRLYDMVRQIRESKTGTSRQAGPLPVGEILKRTMS